jgi:chromosome segregation ATPase
MQVSVLLFENTKLRRFIEKETGSVVMPLPLGLFGEQPLPGQDQKFFADIQGLIKQLNELKLSQVSQVEKPSSSTRTEKETDVLLAKISSLTEAIKKSDIEKESSKRRAEDLSKKNRELADKVSQLQIAKTQMETDLASKAAIIEQLKASLSNPEQFQRKDLIDA